MHITGDGMSACVGSPTRKSKIDKKEDDELVSSAFSRAPRDVRKHHKKMAKKKSVLNASATTSATTLPVFPTSSFNFDFNLSQPHHKHLYSSLSETITKKSHVKIYKCLLQIINSIR